MVLRHKPWVADLELDDQGWANVEDLIAGARKNRKGMTREILQQIVDQDEKMRYSFSDDGTKIRADYGHHDDLGIHIKYDREEPPDVLYHGTDHRYVDSIMKEGIRRMERTHVCMTTDLSVAEKNGGRRRGGHAVILEIDAKQMREDGVVFFRSKTLWLTDFVDKKYFRVM